MGSEFCAKEGQWALNHMMVVTGHDTDGAGGTYEIEKSEAFKVRARRDGSCPRGEPYPESPGYCIYYEYSTETEFFDEGAYWKIQNSWGPDWGDKGFIYFKDVTDNDYGVCNLYLDVQWVETANSTQ